MRDRLLTRVYPLLAWPGNDNYIEAMGKIKSEITSAMISYEKLLLPEHEKEKTPEMSPKQMIPKQTVYKCVHIPDLTLPKLMGEVEDVSLCHFLHPLTWEPPPTRALCCRFLVMVFSPPLGSEIHTPEDAYVLLTILWLMPGTVAGTCLFHVCCGIPHSVLYSLACFSLSLCELFESRVSAAIFVSPVGPW